MTTFGWPAIALFMMVGPCVEIKPVERDALNADRNLCQHGADLGVEYRPIHSEVLRRVADADETRLDFHQSCSLIALFMATAAML